MAITTGTPACRVGVGSGHRAWVAGPATRGGCRCTPSRSALERNALAVDLVGLHLAEAHELVTALQEVLVPAQISEALAQRRCCAHCGRAYRHKDTKKITLRTLFGTLDIDSPRWISCPCQSGASTSFSPLATTLAEHATPELVYLQARFATAMSYAQTAALLGEVLPLGRTLHPSGSARSSTRSPDVLPRPDMPLTVGLDGGYVHSCTQTSRKDGWSEVVAGKSMPTDGVAKCFAFVQKIKTKPRRRLFEVLSAQGMQANQSITFLTDGGEDIRDLPLYLYPQAEHYLDWFHITMRLTVMMNTAKSLPAPADDEAEGSVDRDQVAKEESGKNRGRRYDGRPLTSVGGSGRWAAVAAAMRRRSAVCRSPGSSRRTCLPRFFERRRPDHPVRAGSAGHQAQPQWWSRVARLPTT